MPDPAAETQCVGPVALLEMWLEGVNAWVAPGLC